MKLNKYDIWHKNINKFTSYGVVITAQNKKEAIELSGVKTHIKAVGGLIKDLKVNKSL
jgi:hypothetical protein